MRVALLHNPRPLEIPAGVPDDLFEEYDGAGTIDAITAVLERTGVRVEPVVADAGLARALESGGFGFAFNIAEGHGRRNREALAAAVCELLAVPYTGSDPLTLAITLDKWAARRLVSPEVPVARAALVRGDADGARLGTLRYPSIVKPNDEGSSKGIRGNAVVRSAAEALERARRLSGEYGCPVLVEEFLPGPEVTVGLLGNGESTRILGTMEISPVCKTEEFVYSLEVKRDFNRRVRYHIPPRLPEDVRQRVEFLALQAYELLGCHDVARMDFRLDDAGEPHFLECNPLPGLHPEQGDIVILARRAMPYAELVQGIFRQALNRTGVQLA